VDDVKGHLRDDGRPIIVFDAMCVLCSANAQFVLRHDRPGVFRLASMQGEVGRALYGRFRMDSADPSLSSKAILRFVTAMPCLPSGPGCLGRGGL
jgi:predicted DCC family thiol-disulfide oxidoreductase YuxK